jgi:signal transduction histidine kinase
VLAGLRLGLLAGAATGFVAGLLAGPLSGHLVASVWLPRAGAFVLIGAVVGLVSSARSEAWRREREVAERESALVAQRASLVQLVSHEFRTPLTIIRGSLETLAGRKDAIAPAFRELVVATERSVDRLQEMADVVLATADELDTGSTPRTRVQVRDLVVHAARSLDHELPDRVVLDVPEHSAVVTVEPFTQADPSERRSHQGLGLGLYTARRLARRLGGDVTVRANVDGHGTTATIVIPDGGERDDWQAAGLGTDRVDRPACATPRPVAGAS